MSDDKDGGPAFPQEKVSDLIWVHEKLYRDAEKAGWDMSRLRIVQSIPLSARKEPGQ